MMDEMAKAESAEEMPKEGGDFESLLSEVQSKLAELVEVAPDDKKEMIAGFLAQLSEAPSEPSTADMMSGGKKGAKPMMG